MKHIEGTFKGFEGLNLYFQSWYPDEPAQAMVVLVHGLGGHSNLFSPAVEYLISQGYEVYGFDLRGHGRSPGQRGHVNRWTEFREDLGAFLQHIQSQHQTCPCFLWGHSLGGTIVLDYALRSPGQLQGLIVTSPALGKVCISPVKLAVGRLLSSVLPRFSLKLGIRNDLCEQAPEACAMYLQDPLRHEYGSARLATEFFATVDWLYKHPSNLQIPLLLLHGSADRVTFPEESRAFFQQLMFSDKEHREYTGHYHDLYLDVDYQSILADMVNWFKRHLEDAKTCQPSSQSSPSASINLFKKCIKANVFDPG